MLVFVILSCVSIYSVDVTGEKYWIVLINSESSTASYWADGSSSTYRRWESGKPEADSKTCVYYKEGGLFKDESCTEEERYTCKMAAGIRYVYCDIAAQRLDWDNQKCNKII